MNCKHCKTLGASGVLLLAMMAHGPAWAEPAAVPQPDFVRMPAAQPWTLDVTERLERINDRVGNPAEAATAKADKFATMMGRAALSHPEAPGGEVVWWRAPLQLPADAVAGAWPVALEIDESRQVVQAWWDGQELPRPDRKLSGDRWIDGNGILLLPLTAKKPAGTLVFRAGTLTHLYDNGFGRMVLRPATLSEAVVLEQLNNGASVRLRNRAYQPMTVTLHVRHEDYFGITLAGKDEEFALGSQQSSRLVALEAPGDPALYKSRVWLTAGRKVGHDYWVLKDPVRENWNRPEVLKLDAGWEYAPAQTLGDTPPESGWKPARMPHKMPSAEWTTHHMWYRTTLTVPAEWKSQRAQLFFSDINSHAVLYVDGQRVAERAAWQLPDAITLPENVKPGTQHSVWLAVTDYSVGLAPGIKAPEDPRATLPGRARAAAVALQMGVRTMPELLGVPAVRAEFVPIRTPLAGGPQVDARVELRNDSAREAKVQVAATVLQHGKEVARLPVVSATVPANGSQTVPVAAATPGVKLWELDDPQLHELRVEVKDETGATLDVRRERFGFRQFGIAGEHFTLNGRRVNVLGGSHIMLNSRLWPVSPHPYRIVRQMFQGPPGFGEGRVQVHLADEMGVLMKQEHPHHNAMHADFYAYQTAEIWDRLRENFSHLARTMPNHPATMFWDVGNELFFPDTADKMAQLQRDIRTLDPERLVVNGGGMPDPAGVEVNDWHGFGERNRRDDYYYMHPEDRPSYNKTGGFYSHVPAGEPKEKWTVLETKRPTGGFPANGRAEDLTGKLLAYPGKPVLFSEGHYYENSVIPELVGMDSYRSLAGLNPEAQFDFEQGPHWLNWLASRTETVAKVRQAGFASAMIHVDRGVGKAVLPLAAFSFDRKIRFESGEPLHTTWTMHNDLSGQHDISARWTLLDGDAVVAETGHTRSMASGDIQKVTLHLPLPPVTENRDYRLHVEVTDGAGVYRSDTPITVFAPRQLALPAGQTLQVFDPKGAIAAALKADGVAYEPLAKLADFAPAANRTLLVGSEGLSQVTPAELAELGKKIAAGARAVVLDHRNLPAFLERPLTTRAGGSGTCYAPDPSSPITRGLLRRDLQYWVTKEGDQLSYWTGIETPTTGNFRVHVDANRIAPVLEVAQGNGRVLLCQMNLQDALGTDPAAKQVLANVLQWTGEPTPFEKRPTLLLAGDPRFVALLRARFGVEGEVTAAASAESVGKAKLIVTCGTDTAVRDALTANKPEMDKFLARGGTLFVQGLDTDGANWLGSLLGTQLDIKPFPSDMAYLTQYHPLTAGLSHGDFIWTGVRNREDGKPLPPKNDQVGHVVVSGPEVKPLVSPAYLGVIERGPGRVVINLTRTLDYPVTVPVRLLSTLLSNSRASLKPGGITESAARVAWEFAPIDLGAFANYPLKDDETGRRGWNHSGSDNDLRMFPVGRQNLRGVEYQLTNPAQHKGDNVIALAGTKEKGILPSEVKGIPVMCKAERLYFLHNSAWGVPGFTYRVYYLEDRKNWIFGKPDPFVDVVVKPLENIRDWWDAGAVDRGDLFMAGATVAWKGYTPKSKSIFGVEVGVYQMTWDNPYPEKTIESIDILSPGKVGDGQLFVFGITAATRKVPGK